MDDNFSAGNYEQLIEHLSDDEKIKLLVHLSNSLKKSRRASCKSPGKESVGAEVNLSALARPMRKTLV